jgi:hypothetical protein
MSKPHLPILQTWRNSPWPHWVPQGLPAHSGSVPSVAPAWPPSSAGGLPPGALPPIALPPVAPPPLTLLAPLTGELLPPLLEVPPEEVPAGAPADPLWAPAVVAPPEPAVPLEVVPDEQASATTRELQTASKARKADESEGVMPVNGKRAALPSLAWHAVCN